MRLSHPSCASSAADGAREWHLVMALKAEPWSESTVFQGPAGDMLAMRILHPRGDLAGRSKGRAGASPTHDKAGSCH